MNKEKSKSKAKKSVTITARAHVEGNEVIVTSKAHGDLACGYAALSAIIRAVTQKVMQLDGISYDQAKRKVQRKLREYEHNMTIGQFE